MCPDDSDLGAAFADWSLVYYELLEVLPSTLDINIYIYMLPPPRRIYLFR